MNDILECTGKSLEMLELTEMDSNLAEIPCRVLLWTSHLISTLSDLPPMWSFVLVISGCYNRYISFNIHMLSYCYMQVHPPGNYIPMVILIPNYISPPSMVAIFLAICLMAVLQPSRYSVFHSGDTPIQLGLL